MLADKDPATGEYRIPHFIYADAFHSETVAYADLVLPDTTYLERWDCISLLDRPIGTAARPGRRDPPAGGRARSRRAPVPGRADRSRRAPEAAGLRPSRRRAALSRRLPGLSRPPRAQARHRPARRLARQEGRRAWARRAERRASSTPTSPTAASGTSSCRPRSSYLKPVNRAYLARARELGLLDTAAPITLHLYAETLQRFRLAAEGHGAVAAARTATASASAPISTRCRSGTSRSSRRRSPTADFPLHAITQRPMPMYHSWGSQNAWLRQIHGPQLPVHESPRPPRRRASPTATGSRSTSPHGAPRRSSS